MKTKRMTIYAGLLALTRNNLVALQTDNGQLQPIKMSQVLVLYDPDDPNPQRRFKMFYEVDSYTLGNFSVDTVQGFVAYSPDGLIWKASSNNPVIRNNLEPSGLIKFNGCYYVNAHEIHAPRNGGRVMVTYASYDFEHWTKAKNMGFRRAYPPSHVHTGNTREQVHMGASLWNRGNVIIGFYGMWHGHESGDTLLLTMDLGLVVSNDAIHFREPIPDFAIVPAQGERDGAWPALMQGQAFENVGDKTYVWYSSWDEYGWRDKNPKNGGGLVRLATWDSDRLSYYKVEEAEAHFISGPLILEDDDCVFVNASGLSSDSYLTVEILDEQFRKLPGYSGEDCVHVKESGLRQPVRWRNKTALEEVDHPVRIRVNYEGKSSGEIRVYAVYVSEK